MFFKKSFTHSSIMLGTALFITASIATSFNACSNFEIDRANSSFSKISGNQIELPGPLTPAAANPTPTPSEMSLPTASPAAAAPTATPAASPTATPATQPAYVALPVTITVDQYASWFSWIPNFLEITPGLAQSGLPPLNVQVNYPNESNYPILKFDVLIDSAAFPTGIVSGYVYIKGEFLMNPPAGQSEGFFKFTVSGSLNACVYLRQEGHIPPRAGGLIEPNDFDQVATYCR